MSNRQGKARHLRLVPDIPDGAEQPLDEVLGHEVLGDEGFGGEPGAQASVGIVQLTLSVHLMDMTPSVWRQIRVRSDLLIPELHALVQAAMGWAGREQYSMSSCAGSPAHTYGTEAVVAAGQAGQLGDHVRIDSMLASPGDAIQYRYGERWLHFVRVDSVDADVDDLRPTCLDGEGVCPLEEGFEKLSAHPLRDDESRSTTIDAASLRLRRAWRARTPEAESTAASPLIARLFRGIGRAPVPGLLDLLPRCELTIESSVDLPVAARAMEKVSWFLRRVGDGRMPLTADGQLPPAVVEAVRDELDWGIGWVGDSPREADHHQATDLREAMRALGLVRVLKGALVRTRAGSLLFDDPVGLWRHCAAKLPLGRHDYQCDTGTLYLVALAASASAEHRKVMVSEAMLALRWPWTEAEAQKAAHPTVAFLDLIGAHGPLFYLNDAASEAPLWARRFARDALRTSRPR